MEMIIQKALKMHPGLSINSVPPPKQSKNRPLYSESRDRKGQKTQMGPASKGLKKFMAFLFRAFLLVGGLIFAFLSGASGVDVWQTEGTIKTLLMFMPLGIGILGASMLWWSIFGFMKN